MRELSRVRPSCILASGCRAGLAISSMSLASVHQDSASALDLDQPASATALNHSR